MGAEAELEVVIRGSLVTCAYDIGGSQTGQPLQPRKTAAYEQTLSQTDAVGGRCLCDWLLL